MTFESLRQKLLEHRDTLVRESARKEAFAEAAAKLRARASIMEQPLGIVPDSLLVAHVALLALAHELEVAP